MRPPGESAHPHVPVELLHHLEQREHAARAETDRLQAAITELTEQLEHARGHLDRLTLTRRTLVEIAEPNHQPQGIDALPPAYRDILTVFTRSDRPLRAKQLCQALNTGTEPRHVEAMRAKLKRLVGRAVLTEPEPGMFSINQDNL